MIIFLAIIKENAQKKIALAIKREENAKNIVGALKHVVLNSLVANASGNVGLLVSVHWKHESATPITVLATATIIIGL